MGHQSADLLHKACVISEDESQHTPGMLSIQNLQGFNALPLPFKIHQPSQLQHNRQENMMTKRENKGERIQNVFLPLWNNVAEALAGTGLRDGQVNEWSLQQAALIRP